MLDHPWLRVVLGVLAAAALGALAARVALSVPGEGGPSSGSSAAVSGGSKGGSGSGGAASGGGGSGSGEAASGGSGGGGSAVRVSEGGGSVVVHVVGAVRHPGVYTLREGQRIKDAVHKAGGATKQANPQGLNLAAPARDGQQIVMPARQTASATAGGGGAAGSSASGSAPGGKADGTGAASTSGPTGGTPVDLNTATLEELQTLDGVGPTTAQKIVKLREERGGLGGVDDLDEVPGIGPKKLEAIRAQLDGGG